MALRNVLYLTVLPLVRLPKRYSFDSFMNPTPWNKSKGIASLHELVGSPPIIEPFEQVCTLFPDRSLATRFFEDEVQQYVQDFEIVAEKYMKGGHVDSYEFELEKTEDGRFVVRVIQNVK
jgi:hypothetical protein